LPIITLYSLTAIITCLFALLTFFILLNQPTETLFSFGLIFILPSLPAGITGIFGLVNAAMNVRSMMNPDITITNLDRRNTQAIDQAAAILTDAFKQHWPDAWPTHEEAHSEVLGMLAEDRICRMAVDRDGTVVGWIGSISEYDGNIWELHPLAIRPDRQQQGIGRALVQDLEREVNQRGGLTIRLGSDDQDDMTSLSNVNLYEDLGDKIKNIQNFKGHPFEFYQKLGYTIIGVMPDANGRGKPDIIMGKRIG
jgi:aminoglycoside 6'-N-acetyltransferase I